jgi:hypothetical protein
MAVIDGFEILIFALMITCLVLWGIPFELFQLYQMSQESYFWLFVFISIVFFVIVTFYISKLKQGKLTKTNFCGNIIAFGVVVFGGLAMFLKMVQP